MNWFDSEAILFRSGTFTGAEKPPKLIAIQAKNLELLELLNFQLAINIASMQEMHPDVVSSHFSDLGSPGSLGLRERKWFYCCNRETKILPDGIIVNFKEYP